uniref:Helix-turn-helix domain-containing protein n=1 Tax=Prevotella sp. GTC17262 TaxID=3236797 RepID=A0AB33JIN3_9BACT
MNIQELIKSGTNVTVTVTPTDLKDFALQVIKEYVTAAPQAEQVYTRKQFAQHKGVSLGTLWRWEKAGILTPTRAGAKVWYKDSDLKEVKL